MKWGVRRYQNPDGTLTAAGKAKYGASGKYEYESRMTKKAAKKLVKTGSEKDQRRVSDYKSIDQERQRIAESTSKGRAAFRDLFISPRYGTALAIENLKAKDIGKYESATAGQKFIAAIKSGIMTESQMYKQYNRQQEKYRKHPEIYEGD